MTREQLATLTDAELLERQKSCWTIGAADDAVHIAACDEEPFDREQVIDFILDCETEAVDTGL